MNKKDLSIIKKHFKQDSERLNISDIYNVYCKAGKTESLFEKKEVFSMLDESVQEMYLKKFKKILMGTIDTKVFELEFKDKVHSEYQENLLSLISDNLEKENVDKVVTDILKSCNYDTDILISFINCELAVPIKNKKSGKTCTETDYSYNFVICSIGKVQTVNPDLTLDVIKKDISMNSSISNLMIKNPIEGFVYPTFNEGFVNVNTVMYNSSKSNFLDIAFIKNVIGCTEALTAESEKEIYDKILNNVLGEKIKTDVLYDIYDGLTKINADGDNSISEIVSVKDIHQILKSKGIDDIDTIRDTLEEIDITNPNFEFKVENIIPQKGKSIRIKNNNIDISLSTTDLSKIKQVNNSGRKCLIIELKEDVEIQGFKLETEKL